MNGRTKTDLRHLLQLDSLHPAGKFGFGGVLGCFGAFRGVPGNPDGFGTRPDDMGRSPSYAGAYCVARGATLGGFGVSGRVGLVLENSGCPRDP